MSLEAIDNAETWSAAAMAEKMLGFYQQLVSATCRPGNQHQPLAKPLLAEKS